MWMCFPVYLPASQLISVGGLCQECTQADPQGRASMSSCQHSIGYFSKLIFTTAQLQPEHCITWPRWLGSLIYLSLIPGKLQWDVTVFMEIWGCHSRNGTLSAENEVAASFVCISGPVLHTTLLATVYIIIKLLRTRSFSATYCTPSSRLVTSVIHGGAGQWLPPFSWAVPCLKKHWLILVMLWHYEGLRSLSPIALFGGLCRCAYPFTGGSVVSLHKSGHRWAQCFGHTWLSQSLTQPQAPTPFQ